jgi:hypothetical protein
MEPGIYIMTPEPISAAYFIKTSGQSVCLHVYHHNAARQRLGKNVTAATNTRNNTIFEHIVFYAVLVASEESR